MHTLQVVQCKRTYLAGITSLVVMFLISYFSVPVSVEAQDIPLLELQSSIFQPPLSSEALQSFKGEWHFHSGVLTVESNGDATFITRAYRFCGPEVAQPCDAWQGNTIIPGIKEELTLTKIDGSTAYGIITASTDNKTHQQVMLTLQPHNTLEFNRMFLCGPQGPVGYCGA